MKRSLKIILLIGLILFCPLSIHAWNGYDYDSGDYIEIENQVSVFPGQDIEIYDYNDETYHDVNIMSVAKSGSAIIQVFDHDTGDYRTFEMDDESMRQNSMPPSAL